MKKTLSLLTALFLLSNPAAAELIHGTFNSFSCGYGFDFSELSCTTDDCLADFGIAQINPPISCDAVMACWCGASCSCEIRSTIAILPGTTLAEVEWAPEDPAAYGCGDCIGSNTVYVIHTADGLYAKFRFTTPWIPNEVEYYVQTDGTRNLGGVPVEDSTWGEIKVIYE